MTWLDDIRQREGDEKWLELIKTLRDVTEGKVRFTPRNEANAPCLTFNTDLFGNTSSARNPSACSLP